MKAVETWLYRARQFPREKSFPVVVSRSAHPISTAAHLPKARIRILSTASMRPLRAILAIAFAFLFVFSTNRCAIAAAFPGEVEECCPDEKSSGESERGLPCGSNGCQPCATLESGVHPASLVPLTIVAPVWTESEDLARLLRCLAAEVRSEPAAAPPDPAAIPSPHWLDVVKKALPVRGPSLAA